VVAGEIKAPAGLAGLAALVAAAQEGLNPAQQMAYLERLTQVAAVVDLPGLVLEPLAPAAPVLYFSNTQSHSLQ
jgi:hypothetical protein